MHPSEKFIWHGCKPKLSIETEILNICPVLLEHNVEIFYVKSILGVLEVQNLNFDFSEFLYFLKAEPLKLQKRQFCNFKILKN